MQHVRDMESEVVAESKLASQSGQKAELLAVSAWRTYLGEGATWLPPDPRCVVHRRWSVGVMSHQACAEHMVSAALGFVLYRAQCAMT